MILLCLNLSYIEAEEYFNKTVDSLGIICGFFKWP